jgi:hypothetical protein
MRYSIILLLFALILFSCGSNTKTPNNPKRDNLSEWFISNEDSLYTEFVNYVFENSLCSQCDTSWGEMTYMKIDSNSYMGRFSLEATAYCDSIEVNYIYNKYSNPKTRIRFATHNNEKCNEILDTVLIFLENPKFFKIEKSKKPYN